MQRRETRLKKGRLTDSNYTSELSLHPGPVYMLVVDPSDITEGFSLPPQVGQAKDL